MIRITGALSAREEKFENFSASLDVKIADKPWTLRVRDVQALTTNVPEGIPLLRNLGGFLIITGPPELVARLESEEFRGHPLAIEGRLYVGERVLILTAVEPIGVPSP